MKNGQTNAIAINCSTVADIFSWLLTFDSSEYPAITLISKRETAFGRIEKEA